MKIRKSNDVPDELGCGEHITRRDLVNGVLATGAVLALGSRTAAHAGATGSSASLGTDWYGYGGVGDYAASHGNTPELIAQAHSVRDGRWSAEHIDARDTGELYDLVIVGGGMAGLGAALRFDQKSRRGARALVLENHPVLGGESKRNEFMVDGIRLLAPQGAHGFAIPGPAVGTYADGDARYFEELSIPRHYTYAPWPDDRKALKFAHDDGWDERTVSNGWFVETPGAAGRWAHDPWANDLAESQYSAEDRAQILKWHRWSTRVYEGQDFEKWLDARSYADLLVKEAGCGPAVMDYVTTMMGSEWGGPPQAISAYAAYASKLPVASAFSQITGETPERHQFPGGNDVFARLFIKRIAPHALEGGTTLPDIVAGRVRSEALDRPGARVRFRLQSTAVRIEHSGRGSKAAVRLTYLHKGGVYSVSAKAVVMATGGWITKHIVRDLPAPHQTAYEEFVHTPCMVVNVALRNWRPMYDLGLTGFTWWGGDLGFKCAIKRPMHVGDHRPPLDPNLPTVISLYYTPCALLGTDVRNNVKAGRVELYTTPFTEYERRVRQFFTRLFGANGFDARADIAGIILNRWGHALIVPTPGFFFGRDGAKAGREIIREAFDRIAFGHSELTGYQHWGPAAAEGSRAFDQVAPFVRTS
jgi:spermidine dehydrogenase